MIQGVIFDMDGLMFDTERLWDTLWEPTCEALGIPMPEDTQTFFANGRGLAGEKLRAHVQKYFPQVDPQRMLDKIWQIGTERFAQGVPCKPGLRDRGQFQPAQYDRAEFADHGHGALFP